MPTSQDVAKFTEYLYTKVLESQQNYLDVESKANYRALKESILIYLIVFNKKRGTEVSSMTIEVYDLMLSPNEDSPLFGSLNVEQKERALKYKSILVKGKTNAWNFVLVDKTMQKGMSLLYKGRRDKENEFFFTSSTGSYIRHSKVLRKFADDCGVENMQTRLLRRHFATTLGTLSQFQNCTKMMAHHLGHSAIVHE